MKIAIIGYGRMGRMIEEIAVRRGHEVVCRIDVDNQQDFDSEAFRNADVAIEFTNPKAAYGNCINAFRHNVKVVSGSTGWLHEHEDEMRRLCCDGGQTLFWSSNFSVGVAVFNAVNKFLAKIMNGMPEYDVRIEETHHIHKIDAPSGTAVTIAEGIIANIDRKTEWKMSDGEITDKIVSITSFRKGEVPGIHSVKYDSTADMITITHDAHNREGFALGAVLAAEYTLNHKGLLTMDDLFQFKV